MNSSSLVRALGSRHLLTMALSTLLVAACGGGYGGGGSMGGSACGGAYGGSCTPTVSISAPLPSPPAASIVGTVTLSATAAAKGTYTVSSVQFYVDAVAVGAPDTTSPYSYDWITTAADNGVHMITAKVTDSAALTATSAAVSVTVANPVAFALTLSPEQLFPVPASTAAGSGTLVFDKTSGQGSGSITLTGVMTVTKVEIGDAFAGASSAALHELVPGANAGQWDISPATVLSASQLVDLQAGKLYVLVRSVAFAGGELRAQLLPPGISVAFASLDGAAEISAGGRGQVAVTVNSTGLSPAVHVQVAGNLPDGAVLE